MTPDDSYSSIFPLWLGSLWLIVSFVWLLLPLCPHLWRSRQFWKLRGESPLDGYAREGILCRVSLLFVLFFLGVTPVWKNSFVFVFAGTGVAVIVVALLLNVTRRWTGLSSVKWGTFESFLGRRQAFSLDGAGPASLGPCSAEAEAALTDEVMLSLWYGGLNGIYARKYCGAGRWIGTPLNHTPPEYLRAWASDNPHLRTSAYYNKSMLGCFAVIVALMLNTSKNVMIFVDFWDEDIPSRIPRIVYAWDVLTLFTLTSFVAVILPLIYLYSIHREWLGHYRALTRALREGLDPDLCDRARMEEMRRTILGWAWNSGYVRYDREAGWRLNVPSKGSKGGRLVG